jgi:hypothetical protein
MQINSAQDYLTMRKRQILASTYASTPPEQRNKTNGLYASLEANQATIRQVLHVPALSAPGDPPGGITVTNWCSGCEAWGGVFATVNTKDVMSRQALRPIGIRSTVSQ